MDIIVEFDDISMELISISMVAVERLVFCN